MWQLIVSMLVERVSMFSDNFRALFSSSTILNCYKTKQKNVKSGHVQNYSALFFDIGLTISFSFYSTDLQEKFY